MRRLLRPFVITLVVVVGLACAAAVAIYASARQILGRRYDPTGVAVAVPTDSASIAEGGRLARTYGCYAGCHGTTLEGGLFFDQPRIARIVTPNLTRAVRRYSDAELEAIVRRGVRPNGLGIMAMPSPYLAEITDADFGRILAFLRSQPEVPGATPSFEIGPLGYLGVATGQFAPSPMRIAKESIGTPGLDRSNPTAYGRYLARTHCAECHGPGLRGMEGPAGNAPSLEVAAHYDSADFATLLATGTATGGRELKTMSPVARMRFAHLTRPEVDALKTFFEDSLR